MGNQLHHQRLLSNKVLSSMYVLAFLLTEKELHNYTQGQNDSGSTALYLHVSDQEITVASLGDS